MIRVFRFRRLGLKLMSVLLSALLWLAVAGDQVVERALPIPIEFTNLSSDVEMAEEPPTTVRVRVRGSSGVLSRLATGDLVAIVDLREARPGQRLVHLAGPIVQAPFGVDVVQVTPSNLSMTFEASVSKVVPIAPSLEGLPAAGSAIGAVTVEPASVVVVGPASVVDGTTEAVTESVPVAGATAAVTATVDVGVADPRARLRSPQRARVTVAIVPVEPPNPGGAVSRPTTQQDSAAK